MTIALAGSGTVLFRKTYEVHAPGTRAVYLHNPNSVETRNVESNSITVMESGIVIFKEADGSLSMVQGTDVRVNLTEIEYAPFMETEPAPSPTCPRCQDDDAIVKNMVPPVCPACGRGSK